MNLATYLCALAMSTIQFWLGLRFKNFIVPIAIGLLLYILGGVLMLELRLPHADKFPYIFSTLVMIPDYKPDLHFYYWYSAGYALVFLSLAYLDLKHKMVRA